MKPLQDRITEYFGLSFRDRLKSDAEPLLREAAEALSENARLREGLLDALAYMYNPFEPENQSNTYRRIAAVLALKS